MELFQTEMMTERSVDVTDFFEQDDKKKAWTLAMLFFKKCTKQGAFRNNKPTTEFFKVRSFFTSIDTNSMTLLYRYLTDMEAKEMSLTELFIAANEKNAKSFAESTMNKTVRHNQAFDINQWLSRYETS